MNKFLKIILFSAGLILLMGASGFSYLLYENDRIKCATPDPEFFCGTETPKLTENQFLGRELFLANCAVCHRLKQDAVGPALSKIDSTIIREWLMVNEHKIDKTKLDSFGIDYHKHFWGQTLSNVQVSQIIDYCLAD